MSPTSCLQLHVFNFMSLTSCLQLHVFNLCLQLHLFNFMSSTCVFNFISSISCLQLHVFNFICSTLCLQLNAPLSGTDPESDVSQYYQIINLKFTKLYTVVLSNAITSCDAQLSVRIKTNTQARKVLSDTLSSNSR